MNSNTQKALESLRRREINSSIAIAADLANDNPNSICRLALAWISDGNVHGISYLIKPREGPIETRHVTEARLKDSKPFDAVWDEEVSVLIEDAFLSAYHSEDLFTSIKASYEASGRKWPIHDVYIRDLQFLAATYIPNLANDSLTSILHRMDIAVDMDSAISRAMACICGLSWLEERYPIQRTACPCHRSWTEPCVPARKFSNKQTRRETLLKKKGESTANGAIIRISSSCPSSSSVWSSPSTTFIASARPINRMSTFPSIPKTASPT